MRARPASAVWISALVIGILQVVGSFGAADNQPDRRAIDALALALVRSTIPPPTSIDSGGRCTRAPPGSSSMAWPVAWPSRRSDGTTGRTPLIAAGGSVRFSVAATLTPGAVAVTATLVLVSRRDVTA